MANVDWRKRPIPDADGRNLVVALVALQRRCNQIERKMDQFIEDTSSLIEDLYDTVKCHKEVDHG